jgi:hypothetical protein
MNPSGVRGALSINRLMQQSRLDSQQESHQPICATKPLVGVQLLIAVRYHAEFKQ